MKNRKMLSLAVFSMVLIFSLIPQPSAAGASATVSPTDDHSISQSVVHSLSTVWTMRLNTPTGNITPMVAACLEVEFGKWNMVLAVPRPGYLLTIPSTAGGGVSDPGEEIFNYDAGTVIDLVAKFEEGYQFVGWIVDVDTVADINAPSTTITIDGDYSMEADFVGFEAVDLGIKNGDWIKFEYRITGLPAEQPYLEWLKLEFLSVEGTNASVRVTRHISDGTEQIDTVPMDLAAGGGERLSGFVIPANLATGDSVYMTAYGNVTIEGETTRPYVGTRRTVVYTSFSQDDIHYIYYWDKQTGVMVEAEGSMPSFGFNTTYAAKVTETNMWEATVTGALWWPWAITAIAIVSVGFVVYRLKKRKTPIAPTKST